MHNSKIPKFQRLLCKMDEYFCLELYLTLTLAINKHLDQAGTAYCFSQVTADGHTWTYLPFVLKTHAFGTPVVADKDLREGEKYKSHQIYYTCYKYNRLLFWREGPTGKFKKKFAPHVTKPMCLDQFLLTLQLQ